MAWRLVQGDERAVGELRGFGAAKQRFGEEGVRAMLRAGRRPGAVTAPSVAPGQRTALDQAAGLAAALKAGERAGAAAAQREAESELQGQRRDWQCSAVPSTVRPQTPSNACPFSGPAINVSALSSAVHGFRTKWA